MICSENLFSLILSRSLSLPFQAIIFFFFWFALFINHSSNLQTSLFKFVTISCTVKPKIIHTRAKPRVFRIIIFADQSVRYFIPLNISFLSLLSALYSSIRNFSHSNIGLQTERRKIPRIWCGVNTFGLNCRSSP